MKKAQIHMTETIAVLFVFFILVVFGLVFFYKYQQSSLEEKQDELLATKAMDTTLKSLFLPELACTRGEAELEENCLDVMKLNYVGTIFKEYDSDYFSLFSYARITIQQVYPTPRTWIVYDHPQKEWKNKEQSLFSIALRDDRSNSYGFGYIQTEVYS